MNNQRSEIAKALKIGRASVSSPGIRLIRAARLASALTRFLLSIPKRTAILLRRP